MAKIGVAVQITAQTGGFKKSIEEVSAALVKTQKDQLRAAQETRDAFGILRDGQGRIIEGLSQWQKKLGYYVDELGQVRTANDRFVDGLTTLQRKIGLEVDEAGTIYDRAGAAVGSLADKTKQAAASATPALSSIGAQLSKIQRDALTAANAFGGVKDGLDVLLGQGNRLSAIADNVGKLARGALAIGQVKDQLKLIKEQFAGLGKGVDAARAAFAAFGNAGGGFKGLRAGLESIKGSLKGVQAQAALASAQLALVGAAIAAVVLIYQKQAEKAMESIDPALKGLDQYKDKYQEIEHAARAAGQEIKSLADAIKFANAASGDRGNIQAYLDALKANEESGLSSEEQATRKVNKRFFFGLSPATAFLANTSAGDKATDAAVKGLDALGLDFLHAGKTADEERKELFAGVASYVEDLRARYGEQQKESEKIKADLDSLKLVIDAVGDDADRKKELEELAAILEKREAAAIEAEAKAARDKVLADAGVDKFLQTQDKTTQTVESYGETVDKWKALVDNGTITNEEFAQASGALAEKLRGDVLKSVGVSLPTAADGAANAFDELKKALDAGVLSDDQYTEAVKQLQRKAAENLAKMGGVELSAPPAMDTLETYKSQLDAALKRQEINDADYERLLQAYRDKQAATLKSTQDAAAAALAAAQGLDLGAVEKARAAAKSLEERLDEWREAARAGRISEESLRQAEEALTLAIEERDKAAREAAEKEKERIRKEALRTSGADSLRSQAEALAGANKTWRQELDDTMQSVRRAFQAGEISAKDLQQAHKDYKAVIDAKKKEEKARAKEERAQARKSVRDALGVDSLMESLKSPAEKLGDALADLRNALANKDINDAEFLALRGKAVEEYRAAVDDWKEQTGEAGKVEKAAAGQSLADSRELYKAVVNQFAPRSYEKKIEDATGRLANTQDQALQATLAGNELLAQIAAGGAGAFAIFG